MCFNLEFKRLHAEEMHCTSAYRLPNESSVRTSKQVGRRDICLPCPVSMPTLMYIWIMDTMLGILFVCSTLELISIVHKLRDKYNYFSCLFPASKHGNQSGFNSSSTTPTHVIPDLIKLWFDGAHLPPHIHPATRCVDASWRAGVAACPDRWSRRAGRTTSHGSGTRAHPDRCRLPVPDTSRWDAAAPNVHGTTPKRQKLTEHHAISGASTWCPSTPPAHYPEQELRVAVVVVVVFFFPQRKYGEKAHCSWASVCDGRHASPSRVRPRASQRDVDFFFNETHDYVYSSSFSKPLESCILYSITT
jgi:hypothetical protein